MDSSHSSLGRSLLANLANLEDHFHAVPTPGETAGDDKSASSPCLWALAREHNKTVESLNIGRKPRQQGQPTHELSHGTSGDRAECENSQGGFEQLDQEDPNEELNLDLAVDDLTLTAAERSDAKLSTCKRPAQMESSVSSTCGAGVGQNVKLEKTPSMFAAVLCKNMSRSVSKCSLSGVKFSSFAYERQTKQVLGAGCLSRLNSR